MNVGDVMVPVPGSGVILHCATSFYSHAILVSVDPFVMSSQSGDMLWFTHKPEHFLALCEAAPSATKRAFARYAQETGERS